MRNGISNWFATLAAGSLVLSGCMKSGEDATGARSQAEPVLDASHGGARILLPEIDPSALGKTARDTSIPGPIAKGWFELSITGENMPALAYEFPLTGKGGQSFEIKGIPAGSRRSFHGSLLNGNRVLTHEGITVADIQAGAYTDIRLFLAKAGGTANICVVIEGQKLPACAADTVAPPPNPWPVPDSGAIGGCWQVSSAWIGGKVKLFDREVNGDRGALYPDTGAALHITTWSRQADTLAAIIVAPSLEEKWLFRGVVLAAGSVWTGTITNYATNKTTNFTAKSLPCDMVPDPGKVPPDSVPVPPKRDTGSAASIPMPGSGAAQTLVCFEMRFDYGSNACELSGFAKMSFLEGEILFGNILVADRPGRFYSSVLGEYDANTINFYGVSSESKGGVYDTLSLQGRIGIGATMAKGDYTRWPSGKKGNWTMSVVPCGAWTPVYPDSSCFAASK